MASTEQPPEKADRHEEPPDKNAARGRCDSARMAAGAAAILLGSAMVGGGQQAAPAMDEPLKDNLVLWLTFEQKNPEPPHFLDASGCNNHAVAVQPDRSEITEDGGGRDGEGLIASPWVTVPGSGLNLTEWVRVECWIKPSRDMGHRVHTWRGIVSKGISGATDVYGLRFKGHTGSLQFVIRHRGKPYVAEAKRQWKANTWYHLRGEYDGKAIRLYENDVLLAETLHRGRIDTTVEPLMVGTGWGMDYVFSGTIDSLRIWGVRGEAGARTPEDSRIRLYPHESERAVSIRHPAFADTPFIYILPEKVGHAEAGLYGHLEWSPIQWDGPDVDGAIAFRGENERIVFTARMTPTDDSIEVRQSVTNKTHDTWQQTYSFHCLSTVVTPPFQDLGMQRTYIPMAGKGLLTTREIFGKRAVRGVCRMVDPSFDRHEFIDDVLVASQRAVVPALKAEHPLMMIASKDRKWLVGVAAEKACFLFTNGGNSCIHTCPYFGQVKPGQTKTTLSRIYILQGDAEMLRRRYQRDFLQGGRKEPRE